VNGGATYSAASGTTNWFFSWTPNTPGLVTLKSRAVDDSGNQQDPPAEVTAMVPIRVPSDVPTIQSAINVASAGDIVLVAPGTYFENIDFIGKAITVTSESGPQDTIIDGGNAGSVVRITSGVGRNSVLNGFTLQNGRSTGIRIAGSPTITNNVIKNNLGCDGGGIGISDGSPLIQLNTITNNDIVCVRGSGAGISMRGSSAEILDNVISDNGTGSFLGIRGGGIFILGLGATNLAIIKRNIIRGNSIGDGQGGGINMEIGTKALIVQNLIIGNKAGAGGGIWSTADNGVSPIVNNTIADNDAIDNGSGIYLHVGARMELTNNIIVAKPG